MKIFSILLLAALALPVLVGAHAVIAISEMSGGFGGWAAAVAINTALAATVFAIALMKGRKA